jgi:hypothetical protein
MNYIAENYQFNNEIKIDEDNNEYKELIILSIDDIVLEKIRVYNFNEPNYTPEQTINSMGIVFGLSQWIID